MTDARTTQRQRGTGSGADLESELNVEVVKDLDPPSEDAVHIRGGYKSYTLN
jgi:hypothetical protein